MQHPPNVHGFYAIVNLVASIDETTRSGFRRRFDVGRLVEHETAEAVEKIVDGGFASVLHFPLARLRIVSETFGDPRARRWYSGVSHRMRDLKLHGFVILDEWAEQKRPALKRNGTSVRMLDDGDP